MKYSYTKQRYTCAKCGYVQVIESDYTESEIKCTGCGMKMKRGKE